MAYQNLKIKVEKITKTFADFATGSTTNTILSGFDIPPRGLIYHTFIKASTTFSGGAIASYVVKAKLPAVDLTFNTNVFTGESVTQGVLSTNIASMTVPAAVSLTATSTGANLDQATQGSVDIWIFYSVLD